MNHKKLNFTMMNPYKKFHVCFVLLFLMWGFLWNASVKAQVPARFNHQAVVRDGSGQLLPNHSLSLRISIEQGTGAGAVVRYRETHGVTTNANGLYTLEVGGGAVVLGSMDILS